MQGLPAMPALQQSRSAPSRPGGTPVCDGENQPSIRGARRRPVQGAEPGGLAK